MNIYIFASTFCNFFGSSVDTIFKLKRDDSNVFDDDLNPFWYEDTVNIITINIYKKNNIITTTTFEEQLLVVNYFD